MIMVQNDSTRSVRLDRTSLILTQSIFVALVTTLTELSILIIYVDLCRFYESNHIYIISFSEKITNQSNKESRETFPDYFQFPLFIFHMF